MCIANGLDAGLMSNAVWKGVPLHDLLDQAGVLSGAARVRFQAVDNYTDTIPFELMNRGRTLLSYEINGAPLAASSRLPVARDRAWLLRRKKCEMAHPDRRDGSEREGIL